MNLKRVLKVKDELQRVQDMAISRNAYVLLCLSNFPQFFKNLAKICSFDDIRLQKHWGSEAITKLQDVLVVKLKKDNKKRSTKNGRLLLRTLYKGIWARTMRSIIMSIKENGLFVLLKVRGTVPTTLILRA